MNTIQYYDKNAQQFFDSTIHVDMNNIYQVFLQYLPNTGNLLDVGCGSGRDTLYFKQKGYQVSAMDASQALCDKASAMLKQPVLHMTFQDIDWENQFDGIWACASLLHCPQSELLEVFKKINNALKPEGILYMSFKYGTEERIKDGRAFTDLTEATLQAYLLHIPQLKTIKQWKTEDNRADRKDIWLNVILQKTL